MKFSKYDNSCLPPIHKGAGIHRLQNAISEYTAFFDLQDYSKIKINIYSDLIKGQSTI